MLDKQRSALLAMYNSWTNVGFTWSSDSSTNPCISFGGVTCTQGIVTGLERQGAYASLTGPINSAVSALTALTILDFTSAQLTGSLPAQLSTLTALTLLSASGAGLNGSVPLQISAMTSLQKLSLSSNHLTGAVPEQLSALTLLDYLNLSGNSALTGTIPPALSAIYARSSNTGTVAFDNHPAMCGDTSSFPSVVHTGSGLGIACTKTQGKRY